MVRLLISISLLCLLLAGCSKPLTLPGKNAILIVVDTLRKDRVGAVSRFPGLSPCLDRLSREGFSFQGAQAASSWTKPSVASLLTGLYPGRHGTIGCPVHKNTFFPHLVSLDREIRTLAECFQAASYKTAAFVTNPHINTRFQFDQGFDDFMQPAGYAEALLRRASKWLAGQEKDQPFFLYLHLIDPHSPYYPPEPYRRQSGAGTLDNRSVFAENGFPLGIQEWVQQYQDWKAADTPEPFVFDYNQGMERLENSLRNKGHETTPELIRSRVDLDFSGPEDPGLVRKVNFLQAYYNGEVRYSDQALDRFVTHLEDQDILENTVLVVTADHGESFLEHDDWGHGNSLFNEQIDVPLIFRLSAPGRSFHGVHTDPVSLVDIYPTLLEMLGLPVPTDLDGCSLWPLIQGLEAPQLSRRPVLSELIHLENDRVSAVAGKSKLIRTLRAGEEPSYSYFDLAVDPREAFPLSLEAGGAGARALKEAIDRTLKARALKARTRHSKANGEMGVLSEDEIQQMRELGYM